MDDVKWSGGEQNITIVGAEMDAAYLDMVKGLSIYPDICAKQHDLKIVYTPIHGTGILLVPKASENLVLIMCTSWKNRACRMAISPPWFIPIPKKPKR